MDFVEALRTLWRRKALVALSAVLAVFAGLGAGYEVGLAPPSVKARSVEYGTGSAKVLVDTTPTSLTDSGVDYEPLVTRANIYARLFSTSSVRRYISNFSGIPINRIVTEVPTNGRLITNQPANRPQGPSGRSAQIGSEDSSYRLDIDVESDLPIISIVSQAPTEAEALRLVNGAAQGIETYVRSLRPRARPGSRGRTPRIRGLTVKIRRLGDAGGSSVGGQTGQLVAILVAVGLLLVACVLIVTLSGVARKLRERPVGESSPGPAPPPKEARSRRDPDPVEAGK